MEHRATALCSLLGRQECLPYLRPVALWLLLPECGFFLNAGGRGMEHRATALCSLLGRQKCLPYLRPVALWLIIIVMVFYRRRLPHWQPGETALFLTWRLHGSLPAAVARDIARKRKPRTTKACEMPSRHDKLDDSFFAWDKRLDSAKFGPLWLKDRRVANMVEKALQGGENKLQLYHLHAYAVMPNHVHMLVWPGASLERISRALKGFTARQANKILGRTGQRLWQQESFDHWVRSEESFSRIAAYVEHNPVRAGLAKRPQDWPWSSAHK